MSYREQDIIGWGVARNLIGATGEGTRIGQQAKTEEEFRELLEAIETDDRHEQRDAIGDIYVTVVMQAQMWGLTIADCCATELVRSEWLGNDSGQHLARLNDAVSQISDAICRDDIDEVKFGISNALVELSGLSSELGFSLAECIDAAWNEIKDRKGRMINGIFVKEAA